MQRMDQKAEAQWRHTNSKAVLAIHLKLQEQRTRKQRRRLTKTERVNSIMEYARAHNKSAVMQYLRTARRGDDSFTYADVLHS